MPILLEWTNFYVILGSAAGALTGLQFVVMALIADMPVKADEIKAAAAFATPTIVHFVAVLLFSASTAMPFHSLKTPAGLWLAAGVCGLIYSILVTRRMIHQTAYAPVLEDWLFHAVLPIAGYVALATGAYSCQPTPVPRSSPSPRPCCFCSLAPSTTLGTTSPTSSTSAAPVSTFPRSPSTRVAAP